MKEKYYSLYSKVTFYFTLIFAIYTLFGRFTWLHQLVEHTINSFVYIFAGFFGLFLFLIDFFVYKNYKKMRFYIFYIIFIVCAALSTFYNYKYGIRSNLTTLIWLTVQMGLFTTLGQVITKEAYHKWLKLFSIISGGIWCFASLFSIVQYFIVDGYLIAMNGRMIRQSLYDNRLFGVFIDPNLGAFVGLLVIWGMIFLIRTYKKSMVSFLCSFNIVIQVIYIILSGSRSVQVCIVISFSYAIIYYLHKKYKETDVPVGKKILSYILVPVTCAVIVLGGFTAVQYGVSYLGKLIAPEHHASENDLKRTDIAGNETNNRSSIWMGYLELWKDRPILGISPRNGWEYADQEHPDGYIASHHYDVHNAYIAVLVGMGILGFSALAIIMFLILRTILPRSFDIEKMSLEYFIALQLILNIAVFICFYPGIFFTNGIDTVLFWIAIGYVLKEAQPFKRKKK